MREASSDGYFLGLAVEKTRLGIAAGQHPYGAAIARDGQLIACEHNGVLAGTDPTAHAEVVAIRSAARVLGTVDLSGCTIYCTCEPCVMCFGACYWAGLAEVVYGADIADKASLGLVDPNIRCLDANRMCSRPMIVRANVDRAKCVELFRQFLARNS